MKTWEMIKELTENPRKEFKSIHENKSIAPTFAVMGDGGILFENSLGKSTALYYIGSDWRWKEVKEPVTWKEAFEAGLQGKRIKPKGQYLTFPDYEDLLYTFKYLTERPGYFKKVMLDDWYIED